MKLLQRVGALAGCCVGVIMLYTAPLTITIGIIVLVIMTFTFKCYSFILVSREIRQLHHCFISSAPRVFSTTIWGKSRSYCTTPKKLISHEGSLRSTSKYSDDGIRLNKCIPVLSRRGADEAIQKGSVSVNGVIIKNPGHRVSMKDKVSYEGRIQQWQEGAEAKKKSIKLQRLHEERNFIYLKYWKPRGVTSTSDPNDSSNIITAGGFHLFPQRVFTVGRLDKESTGLILLTSDGRVNHAMLGTKFENNSRIGGKKIIGSVKEKVYEVEVGPRAPTDVEVQRLRDGVLITTEVQKDNNYHDRVKKQKKIVVSAKTLPCKIRRIGVGGGQSNKLEFTLVEGRNRQIRKMIETLGLSVLSLHRTSFAGITLRGLSEGNWLELDEKEVDVIEKTVKRAAWRDQHRRAEEEHEGSEE